ncbi:MAG: cysteine desulfurase [Spirochaetes bacterium]|nr:cysteine desulfurase [Spirochaetota bacterium]
MKHLYLDWAATSPIHPEVAKVQKQVAEEIFGNPSSIHDWGLEARDRMESCRQKCAKLLGAKEKQVIFTGGGSESNNLVFLSFLLKANPGHAIVPLFEHASVYEPSRILERFGWEVTRVPTAKDGRIEPEKLEEALTKNTALVTLMMVNNETGALQPIEEVVRRIRTQEGNRRPIHIHVDAVQAVGKFPIHFQELGIDSLSVSAHKFRGPRGVGMLLVRKSLSSLLTGGGQEFGVRPGTENVPGIVAMTRALELAYEEMEQNRRQAEQGMNTLLSIVQKCKECKVLPETRLSNPTGYSPYIVSLAFPPIPGEVLVRVLNERGFGVSTGSACSSRKKRDTRVLEASGVSSSLAFSSIRISIGPTVTKEQIELFADTLLKETSILFQVAK